jgi:hypothetical protein
MGPGGKLYEKITRSPATLVKAVQFAGKDGEKVAAGGIEPPTRGL